MDYLKGFDVVFHATDGDKIVYHFLWADSIVAELKQWESAYDVESFDVIDCATGEVMFSYLGFDKDTYVSPDWKKWGVV